MSFKMIANRSVYRIDDGKEYKKDEPFTVATEKERDRLVRNKRARVDETKEVVPKPPVQRPVVEPDMVRRQPVMQQKVMTAEEAPAAPVEAPVVASEPELPKPNRYRRSDLRAED